MNNNVFNKLGLGVLVLSCAFFGYAAYSLVFAGNAPATFNGRAIASRAPAATNYSPAAKGLPATQDVREENITLSESNTVVFRSVVDPLSVAKAQQELLKKDKNLGRGKPIYLVLDTPGGDISAGNMLIDTALGLSRPVHTITNFAASMGFNFVQRLGNRYITPSGTLMAHRARVSGLEGQLPGELLTTVGFIYSMVTKMEKQNAARLGISFEAYTALVKDEYWVTGEDAVAQNAADSIVNLKCDDSLQGTTKETFNTFFGPVTVTFSQCPAIQAPLDLQFGGDKRNEAEVKRYLRDYNLLRRMLIGSELKQPAR